MKHHFFYLQNDQINDEISKFYDGYVNIGKGDHTNLQNAIAKMSKVAMTQKWMILNVMSIANPTKGPIFLSKSNTLF